MNKSIVLSVDDDENLQIVLSQYLENNDCEVLTVTTLADALQTVEERDDIDIILLDLKLPDGAGLSIIPQIKAKTKAGVLVVSGQSDTTEKIVCLEMGADDYLTKPFELRELSARIKAVTRRIDVPAPQDKQQNENGEDQSKIEFSDGWYLDRNQYQLFDKDNNSAELTTGEFELLEALVTSPNRALSREQLFDLTRDGQFDIYDRAIDIQIARLRKKLQDDTKSPKLIKTIRGVGYMFCNS